MSQQNNDNESGIALFLVFSLIAATVIGVVWFGASTILGKKPVAPVEVISSISASTVPVDVHGQPFVLETETQARYYFTQDQAAVPADAEVQPALSKLLALVQDGGFLQLVPFNGALPATAAPEALVQQRIAQVREQLSRLGVPAEKLQIAAVQLDADSQDWAHAQRIALVAQPAGAVAVATEVVDNNAGPSIAVEDGVVKFYFAVGSDDLAPGASEALLDVIAAVNSGKRAVISGYTDSTGDAAINEELSKKRALTVQETLISLNVPADKIELQRPLFLTGTGSNVQARRVEVRIQD